MLDPTNWTPAPLPADLPPLLYVVVDTEEEFDWSKPFDRQSTGVASIAAQPIAHRIFDRHGIKPCYMVDYPVASQACGIGPLKELYEAGRCEIGAHLHPWVSPPFDEPVDPVNSYPGNLPAALEREKLTRLTDKIGESFGRRPTLYRAGRYGVGPATAATLDALGYLVDASVVPQSDFRSDHGPDFRHCGPQPYWFGEKSKLLEVPLSVGFVGALAPLGTAFYGAIAGQRGMRLRLPGICARLGLFERIKLTPEGVTAAEHARLVETMLGRGQRIFGFTYHSPSLAPGHTPYVRNDSDLKRFLAEFEIFFEHFFGHLGGRPTTLTEIHRMLDAERKRIAR